MRVVMFYHSLVSCWNHGNAHFLRGVVSELIANGHRVDVYEPAGAWSRANLEADGHGPRNDAGFAAAYPGLSAHVYDPATLDLGAVLDGADLVLIHEWSDHDLVARVGRHRAEHPGYVLLFHDTHHRAVTEAAAMAAYDLEHYDGVLAFGNVIRDLYVERGWARRAWTWHEAADARVFRPLPGVDKTGGLVWVGNWGDGERTAELHEFLLGPVQRLGLRATVHGVRYPDEGLTALADAGIVYGGWLPNYEAPAVFARHKVTVHVPRRPYVEALPGIPTIRVFEALACGIPLVSAPWDDAEGLFTPGADFLVARNGREMETHLRDLVSDADAAAALAARGRETVLARHTCAHRVAELESIYREVSATDTPPPDPLPAAERGGLHPTGLRVEAPSSRRGRRVGEVGSGAMAGQGDASA